MSKATQRKKSAFDKGVQYNKLTSGVRSLFTNPYTGVLAACFINGFKCAGKRKKKVVPSVVDLSWRAQIQKNQEKRKRQQLKRRFA